MAKLDYNYLADLVKQAQNNDSDAFAQLYIATYDAQYRYAYYYLKDEQLAQDALQEVYIVVLNNIRKLKDPLVFVSWLNRINFRTCFNLSHKERRFNQELAENNMDHLADNHSSWEPEKRMALIARDEELLQAVSSLPPNETQAILMKYYYNMKLDQIAELLGCSKSSVKRYVNQGLAHLKEFEKLMEENGL